MTKPRAPLKAGLVFIVLGVAQAEAAQVVPAPEWIKNCVETSSTPEAAKPYLALNKPVPTPAENRTWCIGQWNAMHADQKVGR